jgi:hypothetical protein
MFDQNHLTSTTVTRRSHGPPLGRNRRSSQQPHEQSAEHCTRSKARHADARHRFDDLGLLVARGAPRAGVRGALRTLLARQALGAFLRLGGRRGRGDGLGLGGGSGGGGGSGRIFSDEPSLVRLHHDGGGDLDSLLGPAPKAGRWSGGAGRGWGRVAMRGVRGCHSAWTCRGG